MQARRFITFIDACYENKTKLFLSSAKPIFSIFSDEGGSAFDDDQIRHMADLGINTEVVGSSSLFSGDEELFAFARCVSRLTQMSTKEWADESAIAHKSATKKESR
jgi:protein AFG1